MTYSMCYRHHPLRDSLTLGLHRCCMSEECAYVYMCVCARTRVCTCVYICRDVYCLCECFHMYVGIYLCGSL